MKNYFTCYIFLVLIPFGSILAQTNKINESCPKGMISYWKLDEFGDVSKFADSFGGHFAFVQNSNHPSEDSGVVNSARFFYSSSVVDVPNNDVYNWGIHTSFSVELWMKTTQQGTGNKVFIGRYFNKMSWWLGFGNDNKAVFSVRDSAGVQSSLAGKKIINDGKWHHIVAIRNDSLKILQLYVDGSEVNKVSTFFTGDFSGNSPVQIGYYLNSYHYSGWLDEIAIYNTILSKDQIEKNYNDGLSGKPYCDQFATDVVDIPKTPGKYLLKQNYPNPFNPSTTIEYSIPKISFVILRIYDGLGKEIETLANEEESAGVHRVNFYKRDLSSGIYFYSLIAGNFHQAKKMILLK